MNHAPRVHGTHCRCGGLGQDLAAEDAPVRLFEDWSDEAVLAAPIIRQGLQVQHAHQPRHSLLRGRDSVLAFRHHRLLHLYVHETMNIL